MMSTPLRKSTAGQVFQFTMIDSTDFKTPKTGLSIANTDIKLIFEGGTTQTSKNSGGATEIGSTGTYYCTFDATDSATLGRLHVDIQKSGALPYFKDTEVLSAAAWDALYASSGGTLFTNLNTMFNTDYATLYDPTNKAFLAKMMASGIGTNAFSGAALKLLSPSLVSVINTVSSQTSFSLTTGPTSDSALVGWSVVFYNPVLDSGYQNPATAVVSAYTGSGKAVTLAAAPNRTISTTDVPYFIPPDRAALWPTVLSRTLDVSATGEGGVDWANVGSPTTAVDLSGTTIKTTQKVDVDTIKTNPVVNAGTVTFPTGATLASTTNITAAAITSNVKKNQALSSFVFLMTDSTTHAPATGLTVAVTRSIDGGAFAAGALSSVTEISAGTYKVDFGAADLNGNVIVLKATATGADTTLERIVTQP